MTAVLLDAAMFAVWCLLSGIVALLVTGGTHG
jgi:hypothetical protein